MTYITSPHLTYPFRALWHIPRKAFTKSLHLSRLAAMVNGVDMTFNTSRLNKINNTVNGYM